MSLDRARPFEHAFQREGGLDLLGNARLDSIKHSIGVRADELQDAEDLEDIAWSFESLGLAMLREGQPETEVRRVFENAFIARSSASGRNHELHDLWLLAVSGTLAHKQPELRLLLGEIDLSRPADPGELEWDDLLWQECCRSLLLLVRKGGAWSDVEAALTSLENLARVQREAEPAYLNARNLNARNDPEVSSGKTRLLGLYHLAEALLALGRYLRTGAPDAIDATLQRHCEHSRALLSSLGDYGLGQVAASAEPLLLAMARASIWYNTQRLSQAARDFVKSITEGSSPVSELWWSQRQALSSSLLDPFKVAISVQMPTSAGKTLLAEFAIVQSLALNPEATVAYVVPTRALAGQITRRLRADLGSSLIAGRNVRVEAAVPVFEFDPTEESLLQERPDVLVTTPEKLDLLVRSGRDTVADLSLIVIDEAHHIADGERGARLELLLSTIKRERGQACRFLLLTPFLPNAGDLAAWLGASDGVAISLDWKPSEQIRALGTWEKRDAVFHDVLKILPSVTQFDIWDGQKIELGPAVLQPKSRSRGSMSSSIALSLASRGRGGTLILTRGLGTSEKRAIDIVAQGDAFLPRLEDDALVQDAIAYIASELGSDYPLVKTLARGVAFHHAGLPPEVRSLVEVLLERGSIRIVAGTSTLAQGVNFPLGAVIVETLKVSQGPGRVDRDLRFSEFWNIAGRAGRALKDPVGLIVYPRVVPKDETDFTNYLVSEASYVVSALADMFARLSGQEAVGLALVREFPALGQFLQYLTHALKVAGFEQATAEVEEILRSSLAFQELQGKGDRETAEKLIRWSTRFMEESRRNSLVGVADSTGLSLPSVGFLAANSPAEMKSLEYWHPDHLFGNDLAPLIEAVELLAQIPELKLGAGDGAGAFNPERVAGIMSDWVNGKTLPVIASAWFGDSTDDLRITGRYLFRHLLGQIPRGLGALQVMQAVSDPSPAGRIAAMTPAMAFYGTRDAKGLVMRMLGVPRAVAAGLGREAPEFTSFASARDWIGAQPLAAWTDAGRHTGVPGSVFRTIWTETGGSAA